jgi:hypothetical protein
MVSDGATYAVSDGGSGLEVGPIQKCDEFIAAITEQNVRDAQTSSG